jgi:AraC family transcriptional regulator
MQMFAEGLPASGYQPDDKPAVELYEKNFESDAATGMFTCLLCVPVRPL